MAEPPITATGTILGALGPHSYTARMPNGKELVVHLPKAKSGLAPNVQPETRVILEFTPYDFEKARIASIVE